MKSISVVQKRLAKLTSLHFEDVAKCLLQLLKKIIIIIIMIILILIIIIIITIITNFIKKLT